MTTAALGVPTLHAPVLRLPRRRRSGCSPATVFETALTDLAAQRATGVITGTDGSLYLHDGSVVHAESPSAPGVGSLLTGCGRLTPAEWAGHLEGHRTDGRPLAEQLVGSGRVSASELHLCHLTAVLDAAFFALGQAEGEIHFSAAVEPRFTLARPMSVRELRAAAGRRRALLDRVWPCPQLDTATVRRRPGAVPRACTRRRRAVLEAADGLRTPAEIARLLGRSTFGTVLDIRHLAAGGLIESAAPVPEPAPAPSFPPVTVPPPRAAPEPSPAAPQVLLPSRPHPTAPVLFHDPSDPHVALLLRIRAGLEARL
ncbi:transcriptional regulator [Kitasatospora sp. NPDC094015]|uniref:transcriptional regulator n=1 Tax=Kitasatospora sp. NPDC094015 TaxID=3155205 RepID=UPI00331C516A